MARLRESRFLAPSGSDFSQPCLCLLAHVCIFSLSLSPGCASLYLGWKGTGHWVSPCHSEFVCHFVDKMMLVVGSVQFLVKSSDALKLWYEVPNAIYLALLHPSIDFPLQLLPLLWSTDQPACMVNICLIRVYGLIPILSPKYLLASHDTINNQVAC